MGLTGGARVTVAAGVTVALCGIGLMLHGIVLSDMTRVLGAGMFAFAGLAMAGLALIHRWVTDTADERRALAAAQREAQGRKDTYLAGLAALENEHARLSRDLAAERANMRAQLKAERQAMEADFEERRAALVSEAMEAAVLMMHSGKFQPEAERSANLIPFPQQAERARERGGVAP
ncbi:hypothetical protein [Streptomyces sp. NPDC059597]|uniref:hypothetical protein n=1 Tax=Streptomyces sp. NPDC059597 TaxID=3346879 RepID=UPI00369525DA